MSCQVVNIKWKKVRILTKKVSQIRASQIRVSQIRVSQIRARQIRASQIRASQIRASQIRASEISSNHRELHGAIFIECFLLGVCFGESSIFCWWGHNPRVQNTARRNTIFRRPSQATPSVKQTTHALSSDCARIVTLKNFQKHYKTGETVVLPGPL